VGWRVSRDGRGYRLRLDVSSSNFSALRPEPEQRRARGRLAPRQLGLSQPTVSRLIAQLEREIGFRLFNRVKDRLVATPQAQMLFEEVDIALMGIERVQTLVRDVNEMNTDQLRIVAPPSFAEGPQVPIISEFMKAHPKVGVSLDSRTRPAPSPPPAWASPSSTRCSRAPTSNVASCCGRSSHSSCTSTCS